MFKMYLLYCFALVFLFGQVKGALKEKYVPDITPLSVYKCDNFDPILDPTVTLRKTDDNGGKALDIIADVKEKIAGDFMLNINVDQFNNGAWQNIYNSEETLCAAADKFVPKTWKKFRQEMVPSIEDQCDIQPAYYELNGFIITPPEVEIPVSFTGKFKVEYRLLTDEGDDYLCGMVEAEIS